MRYRYHLCHLVFVHPTGVSSSRYPSPGASVTHALSRHGPFLVPPMQTPGIRSNIQLHFLHVMSNLMLPRKCQTTRSAVPVYRCGVSLLYIKQPTHCLVCRAVSRLNHVARFPYYSFVSAHQSATRPCANTK